MYVKASMGPFHNAPSKGINSDQYDDTAGHLLMINKMTLDGGQWHLPIRKGQMDAVATLGGQGANKN